MNATFVFDTAKDCRRVQITSSVDFRDAQRIVYELERDLHNIDVFQNYFEECFGNYGKYQHFTLR